MRHRAQASAPLAIGLAVLCAGTAGAAPRHTLATESAPAWVTPEVQAPRVRRVIFESAAARTKVSYFVYVPESYDAEPLRRFPVLYWLHGTGGGLQGVAPLAARFDAAIREGRAPAMLVVFANGLATSMWADSRDGKVPMETIVTRELVPHVDATFRTIARHEGRLIEGFSMGGYGAARLGFGHPELFGAVSILSGGPLQREFKETPRAGPQERAFVLNTVFGGDHAWFTAQSPWVRAERNAAALRGSRIRVVIGDADEMLAVTRAFDAHLTKVGVPHEFVVLPGVDHSPLAVLEALGDDYWRFIRRAFINANSPIDAPLQPLR